MGRNTLDEKDKAQSVNIYVKASVIEKVGGIKEAKIKAKKFLEKEAIENPVKNEEKN